MMMEEEEDRAESAGSSCPSVRSDRSKGYNPDFSGEPGATRGQRSQSAGSSCPSVRSDGSKGRPPLFSGEPGATRVEQQSSEVPSGQSAQQHQTQLDSIFMLLEDNIITFVKNELKKIQKVLSPDYPECLESQRSSSREAFVKITVDFLRRMKQEELADCLQSSYNTNLLIAANTKTPNDRHTKSEQGPTLPACEPPTTTHCGATQHQETEDMREDTAAVGEQPHTPQETTG
ncbi:uncharacterized protein LOC143413219 [Maylandia zebra]|uniref:uncharacterized protein LOC143413219 n=1 Tax=Maylandia zebra TaxID=106582 RepID=UPI00403CFE35